MSSNEYSLRPSTDGANVKVGNVRYPFCSIEGAIHAVATNDREEFVGKFRGFEEGSEN